MNNYQVLDIVVKSIGVYVLSRLHCSCPNKENLDYDSSSNSEFTESDVEYDRKSINVSINTVDVLQCDCEINFKRTPAGVVFYSYCNTMTNSPNKISIMMDALQRANTEANDFSFFYNTEDIDYNVNCKFVEEPKVVEKMVDTASIKSKRSFRNLFK